MHFKTEYEYMKWVAFDNGFPDSFVDKKIRWQRQKKRNINFVQNKQIPKSIEITNIPGITDKLTNTIS